MKRISSISTTSAKAPNGNWPLGWTRGYLWANRPCYQLWISSLGRKGKSITIPRSNGVSALRAVVHAFRMARNTRLERVISGARLEMCLTASRQVLKVRGSWMCLHLREKLTGRRGLDLPPRLCQIRRRRVSASQPYRRQRLHMHHCLQAHASCHLRASPIHVRTRLGLRLQRQRAGRACVSIKL